MNRQMRKYAGVAAIFAVLVWLTSSIITNADGVSSGQAGSVDDPIVTKSYVDEQIKKLTGLVANPTPSPASTPVPSSTTDAANAALLKEAVAAEVNRMKQDLVNELKASLPTLPPFSGENPGENMGTADGVAIITLEPGQTLYGGEGAQVIVRTGKTIAVSNDGNGISDTTAGKDIPANAAIETNHLLVFPREGRGVKPDPKVKTEIFVMVMGNYLLMNADGSRVTP